MVMEQGKLNKMKHYIQNLDGKTTRIKIDAEKYKVSLLSIGGCIEEIQSINNKGKFETITLTYSNYKDYYEAHEFGALGLNIARNGGRIENASFSLNNKKYSLEKNNGNHNLHSGSKGINIDDMAYEIKDDENTVSVIFKTLVESKNDSFPGDLKLNIIYTFNESSFKLTYEAESNEDTICNITNHSYFNLSGNLKQTLLEHDLHNTFDEVKTVNDEIIINGSTKYSELVNKSDKTKISTLLKNNIFDTGCGIDNPFTLKDNRIVLSESVSGRVLEIMTTYPSVVLYSSNFPFNKQIKHLDKETKHIALAIEPQFLPNDININGDSSKTILKKGELYKHSIQYKFKTI